MVKRYYGEPPSDHFDGHRFFNPNHPNTDRTLLQLLRWRFGGKRATWPATIPGRQVAPEQRVDGLRITMIGHATVLIQTAGRNLLVDPVWSERASPLGFAGPKRVSAPGVAFEQLPPIDVVLLTHNHYDHLDMTTTQRLWERDRPRIIAPLGNDAVVARSRPGIIVETRDWREEVEIGEGVTVWLHPAHHWSARGIADRRMALWCGYVIATPAGVVYVAGDTGYGDGRIFLEVAHRFPVVDAAVLPIGAYEPRWFMRDQHVNPAEAGRIMLDCGARQALGVHWGAFPLTDEAPSDPVVALAKALAEARIEPGRFLPLEPGQQWDFPGTNLPSLANERFTTKAEIVPLSWE
jgi:L-ascorbate metabolism protein UlaG (beta-lactamase superfamily)